MSSSDQRRGCDSRVVLLGKCRLGASSCPREQTVKPITAPGVFRYRISSAGKRRHCLSFRSFVPNSIRNLRLLRGVSFGSQTNTGDRNGQPHFSPCTSHRAICAVSVLCDAAGTLACSFGSARTCRHLHARAGTRRFRRESKGTVEAVTFSKTLTDTNRACSFCFSIPRTLPVGG